jgi:hypothetical protein
MARHVFSRSILIALGIICVLVFSGSAQAQWHGGYGFEHIRQVQERHIDQFMDRAGVAGTGVGFDDRGQEAIFVFLEEPNVPGIPTQLEGVRVRPVVTGKIYSLSFWDLWSNRGGSSKSTPAAPTNLKTAAAGSSQIDLVWTDNAGNEQGFKIERSVTGSYSQLATVSANVTSYSDTSLTSSTTYTYRIRAYNNAGNSGYSNTSTATTAAGALPELWCARPVPIGVSTGHPNITAGTIGCRVTNGTKVYALSNNHVFANENKAAVGDNVLQPGKYDGGVNPRDAIGTLADFQKITFTRRASNTIDAALALCTTATLSNGTVAGSYGIPGKNPVTAAVGLAVKKHGRTTGLTHGSIYAINATVNVTYTAGTARFVNQIIITSDSGSFCEGGDSGSLVVTDDDDNSPVGLLFAGSSTHTIANPIGLVLDRFGVTIDGK